MLPTSDAIALTSRARIEHLEGEVNSLWTAVRDVTAKLGSASAEAASLLQPPPPTKDDGNPRGKPDPGDSDDNEASDSTMSELSPTHPPTHLLQLFDNNLLDTNEDGSATSSRQASSLRRANRNNALSKLMPSREDILIITASASSWMPLYNALFPAVNFIKNSDEILLQYDKLQHPNADSTAMAAVLLSVAITVQQAPNDTSRFTSECMKDALSFIRNVSTTVERTVVADDALAGSLDGIEITMLFLRV